MKEALVILPYLPEDKEKLIRSAGEKCRFTFLDKKKEHDEYISAIKTANLIIGEPANDDFQYCENLEILQSSSSGVNYYVEGGKFPEGAKLCCMTGVYGNVISWNAPFHNPPHSGIPRPAKRAEMEHNPL